MEESPQNFIICKNTIPEWKCMMLGKQDQATVYEVFIALREFLSREWVLKIELDFKELLKQEKHICAWMLTVKKLPNIGSRIQRKIEQIKFESSENSKERK